MAIALVLMIFPMLFIGYFFISQAIADPTFAAALTAATVIFVTGVGWLRFLTMEKYLEDKEIGHDESDLGPIEVEEPEPEHEEEAPPLAA